MARKLSIRIPKIANFTASSKTALISLIEREKAYWEETFPEGVPCKRNDQSRLFFEPLEYDRLIGIVSDCSVDQLCSDDLAEIGIKVCPQLDSAIGRVISILASSGALRHEEAIAAVMTERFRSSGAINRNYISGEFERNMQSVSESVEALAVVIEKFRSSQFIKDQEELVRTLVDKINDDQIEASELSSGFSIFVADEVARRRSETSRFRKVRVALSDRYKSRGDELLNDWEKKFSETHDHYINKLQFEAPVTLWNNEKDRHARRSSVALRLFLGSICVMAAFLYSVIFWFGDEISAGFHEKVCLTDDPLSCSDVFSAKGPLMVGAVLLIASLLLWMMKIFNRTYREAGQRAENAAERKSFVETYEAMMQSGQVPEEHRAIILNAIFRPSKDGQPVDDNNGLDVSAVSFASRLLQGKG